MDTLKAIESLGLTSTEAQIYLALLKIGGSTAVQLSKEVQIHRRTIYDNLSILLRKGLVNSKTINGVKYFEANSPVTFKIFLEEKNRTLSELLPILKSQYATKQKTPMINVYVGIQGAKSIIEEAIQTKQALYWVGGGLYFIDALGFSKKFIEEKLFTADIQMIQAESKNIREKLKIFKKNSVRLLPERYSSHVGYLIYGDVVAIGLIQDGGMTMIKVTSKEFSEGYKKYFDIMWNIGKCL